MLSGNNEKKRLRWESSIILIEIDSTYSLCKCRARDHEAQAVARQRTLDEYHRNEMAKARKNFRVVVKANLDPLTNVLVSHVPGGDPRPRGPNAAVVSRVVGLLGDHDGDDRARAQPPTVGRAVRAPASRVALAVRA